MSLSARVRNQRERLGMTQEALAFRAGVAIRTVQRVESGERVPTRATLRVLADALDTTPEALNDDPTPVAS